MTKYEILQKTLSKYPQVVRVTILKNMLKAANKKIISRQNQIGLSNEMQSKTENDIFKTEYGTIHFRKP